MTIITATLMTAITTIMVKTIICGLPIFMYWPMH